MKRYGYIYGKIWDMDNLKEAHKNARKDKTYYKEVKMVDSDPEHYLGIIQEILRNKTYKVSPYKKSKLNDKGKERELMKLPYFPDRIIQWAIMLQIEPIFLKTFCAHTCASIPGRGIHRAIHFVDEYMKDREGCRYCLKMDISKFYPSINHGILKKLLRRKFKDEDLLGLLDIIIDSYPSEKGVPIGSYTSQYFANFYLTYFDHWLKEEKAVEYVVRYMDDIVIFHNSKEWLHRLRKDIEEYLSNELRLKLKRNYQVFQVEKRGVDFVGYRFFFGYKLLRKKTAKRFKRRMRKIKKKGHINYSDWCSINSYKGWLGWCDGFRLAKKYIEPLKVKADRYYLDFVKRR